MVHPLQMCSPNTPEHALTTPSIYYAARFHATLFLSTRKSYQSIPCGNHLQHQAAVMLPDFSGTISFVTCTVGCNTTCHNVRWIIHIIVDRDIVDICGPEDDETCEITIIGFFKTNICATSNGSPFANVYSQHP